MTVRTTRRLVLASESPYRRELLSRLQIPFEAMPHRVEEVPDLTLPPPEQVRKLACEKAQSLAQVCPDSLIIGSDSGLVAHGRLLGKPLSVDKACQQLSELGGGTHELVTGLAITDSATGRIEHDLEIHLLTFRTLSDAEIRRYVERDQPLNCAGSFKIESLGIALFTSIEGSDYTSIMGLPLIRLINLLARFGERVLSSSL